MGIFKTKEERQLEREVEIRRGIQLIRRNIRDLERNEGSYVDKAKQAHRMGSREQVAFLRSAIKRTATQRRQMERQLLNIETAIQIKNQSEAHAGFARSMNALSHSIGEAFGRTDLAETQKQFEHAMHKAESLEQQMEIFLDMSSSSMFGAEGSGQELVSDAEVDSMIETEVLEEETISELDQAIADGLEDVRRQLRERS